MKRSAGGLWAQCGQDSAKAGRRVGVGVWGGGARSPREPAVPFRGSVEPLLGGELIEAVALSLESELLSSLGHCGSTHQAELWPGLAAGLPPTRVSPWCHRNRPGSQVTAPSTLLGRGYSLQGTSSCQPLRPTRWRRPAASLPESWERQAQSLSTWKAGGWVSELEGVGGLAHPPRVQDSALRALRTSGRRCVQCQLPSGAPAYPACFCPPQVISQRWLN